MGPESPCSKRAEAHFAFSKIPTETLGHFRFSLSLCISPLRSLWKLLSLSLSKSRNFESGMIMDEDLDCVEHRSSSTQQEEVAGIAEEKHFKEQQETEVDENFLKLEESGKLKKISGNGNGSKENHSAGVQVQDCTEGLPTSSSSVVVVDENQELGNASKIEEKCLLGSVDEAEETRLVKSADSESFLVGSVNEAEQNHLVKSDDLESWNETVVKSFKTNSRHKSVEAGEKMVQNGDGGKVKPLRGKLKIEVIDDTAVIDSTSIPRSGNGCSRQKTKQETDERRDKRTRRKAKGGKQGLEANGKGKIVAQIVEAQKNESGTKRVYSRKEMEVLRYINSEEQRKMWMEIRCSLGPVVLKEYDGLENCTNHKRIRVNFDPRQQSAKKEEAPAILREVSSSNVDDEMQNLHPLDPAYGHSVDGKDSYADPEECSEDSDSDEDYSSIQRPAFLVEGEPDFDSGPPEDGLEYLRRVRWEAAQIPEVTVAKLDRNKLNKEQTLYMPKIPDIAKCPEHLAPLKKWEDAFLADFAELRAALSHLEDSRVENSDRQHPAFSFHEDYSCQVLESTLPENFDNLTIDSQPLDCSNPKNSDKRLPLSTINEDDTSFSPENSSPRTESSGNYPLLSVILGMDSVARVSMLRKCINSLETKSTLSRSDCMWLFALCAAIDTPLHADTCAALRSLLRKCASLRAEKSELDDEVVMLNILVTIAGRYFKQSEN